MNKYQYFIHQTVQQNYSQFDGVYYDEAYDVHKVLDKFSIDVFRFNTLNEAILKRLELEQGETNE